MSHLPVMLGECIAGLAIKPNGIYIDGTFGRGGHSQAIVQHLSDRGRLIVIDKDQAAIDHAHQLFLHDKRVTIFQGTFAHLTQWCEQLDVTGKVDGILLDLGVSSPQLDDPTRGFSFMQEGPLDMRMDLSQDLNAERYVNEASAEDMAFVFREFGEERFAKRIANAIVQARTVTPITSTAVLAEIIKAANPKWERHKHPATRVFQAIRMHVNQELDDLKAGLIQAFNALQIGGRLVVMSFHSLEDRIVKQYMRDQEEGDFLPLDIPIRAHEIIKKLKRIGKAIKPTAAEIEANIRSRSAILRIGEKLA